MYDGALLLLDTTETTPFNLYLVKIPPKHHMIPLLTSVLCCILS